MSNRYNPPTSGAGSCKRIADEDAPLHSDVLVAGVDVVAGVVEVLFGGERTPALPDERHVDEET